MKGRERSQSLGYYPPAFWKIGIGSFTMMRRGTLPIIKDYWKDSLILSTVLKILFVRFSAFQQNRENSGALLKPFDMPKRIGFVGGVRLQRRRSCVLSLLSLHPKPNRIARPHVLIIWKVPFPKYLVIVPACINFFFYRPRFYFYFLTDFHFRRLIHCWEK